MTPKHVETLGPSDPLHDTFSGHDLKPSVGVSPAALETCSGGRVSASPPAGGPWATEDRFHPGMSCVVSNRVEGQRNKERREVAAAQ